MPDRMQRDHGQPLIYTPPASLNVAGADSVLFRAYKPSGAVQDWPAAVVDGLVWHTFAPGDLDEFGVYQVFVVAIDSSPPGQRTSEPFPFRVGKT